MCLLLVGSAQRKIIILPLAISGLIVIGVSMEVAMAVMGRKSGPIYETPPPQALLHLVPHTPESTPGPSICGAWSSPGGSVGGPISQKYGELRNCLLFENNWIILTEGIKEPDGTRQSGVVAVYRCEVSDLICLSGQENHPLDGWQIYEPPCPGMLSVAPGSLPGKLHIFGTCANYFDITTGTFTNN
jgi:hypothetical protein